MQDGPVARLSALLVCSILFSGCAAVDVRTHSVKTGQTERRQRLDAAAPIATGTWQRDANGYGGPLTWQRCNIENRWTTAELRITRTTPRTDLGLAFVGAGAGLALIGGSQAVEFEDRDCSPGPDNGPERCHEETDFNPGAIAAFVVGLGLFTVGTVMVTRERTAHAETLSKKDELATSVAPCITAQDLPELQLALRAGPDRILPVQFAGDGARARIDLPRAVRLPDGSELPTGIAPPTGVDLPLTVVRVPRGAEHLMKAGQTIGHVRLESDASRAPDSTPAGSTPLRGAPAD